jgi:hypothetical protein
MHDRPSSNWQADDDLRTFSKDSGSLLVLPSDQGHFEGGLQLRYACAQHIRRQVE